MPTPLVRALRRALRESADAGKAPFMQKYMKSEMPYLGVPTPLLRRAVKTVFADHPLESFESWRDAVLELWRGAKHREERYAAIELAGHRSYREYQTLDTLPMYEEMITSGAWWDFVDALASHQIGELLRRHPKQMSALLREWSCCDDMWKRRTAILAQLSFKHETDLMLLYDVIRPSLSSSEFFLRKGIGWALRQYAWTDPAEVKRFVRRHDALLSPLTKREALKNVGGYSSKSR